MKTFSYLALATAQHQKKTAQLALGGNRALSFKFSFFFLVQFEVFL